jgi:ATP adenylyltransferase
MKDPSSKLVQRPGTQTFQSGTLWQRIIDRSRLAIEHGVLRTIDTEQRFLEDKGVAFVIRVASSLAHKERHRRIQQVKHGGQHINPFLPPEPALFVSDVSSTHLAVLNKFNVIEHHLLIVTRRFEHQETLLNESDFAALWRCQKEFPSLGFYNGGTVAGASQSHKHLQLVPLPFSATGPRIPMQPLLRSSSSIGEVGVCDQLPFRHAFVRLGPKAPQSDMLRGLYSAMLETVGLDPVERPDGAYQSGPYNLLVTGQWMLLIPRSQEFFNSVSINGLGYAGSLFVRNEKQVALIEKHGPMSVLTDVGLSV